MAPRSPFQDMWDQTTPTDRVEGGLAYRRYNLTLRRFAKFYGFGIVPTVEAFAATSPNNDYHGNLRSMAAVLYAVREGIPIDDVTVSCYNACAKRAYGYVTGEVSFLDTVRGLKITAFRHNLLYPRTSNMVTVDGHMFGLWYGEENMTMKQAALLVGRSPKMYAAVSKDITTFARRMKLLPCQMQAILWIAKKRVTANKYSVQMHMDHGKHDVSRILCQPADYLPYNVRKYKGVPT